VSRRRSRHRPPSPIIPQGEAWEALCHQCGDCCFEKWIDDKGHTHPTRIPCRFLDLFNRHCTVYEQRFKMGEGCLKLSPENVADLDWLPASCGYRRFVKG